MLGKNKNGIIILLAATLFIAWINVENQNKTTSGDIKGIKNTDDKKIKSIKIGAQVWSVKNLDITTFKNGDAIFEAQTIEEWVTAGENKKAAWCYYEGDPENGKQYGKLYNFYAVVDSRGLAPQGWHIPTDAEWCTLENEIEKNTDSACSVMDWRGINTGGAMKQTGTMQWVNPNSGATNKSGFTALPAGYRSLDGAFAYINNSCLWWAATESTEDDAIVRSLDYAESRIYRGDNNKLSGYSVRCIKD